MYVTDALMVIAENTTHFLGAKDIIDYGKTISKRWTDVIEPKIEKPGETDTRSTEEIVTDMWKKIRGH